MMQLKEKKDIAATDGDGGLLKVFGLKHHEHKTQLFNEKQKLLKMG